MHASGTGAVQNKGPYYRRWKILYLGPVNLSKHERDTIWNLFNKFEENHISLIRYASLYIDEDRHVLVPEIVCYCC